MMKNINPEKLHELIHSESELIVIDVRTPVEFRSSHIALAKNLELSSIDHTSASNIINVQKNIYVVCQSGNRSTHACKKLTSLGYESVISLDGGMNRWINEGYHVIEGKKSISIERQVRIMTGSLVVLGIVLSQLVNISFISLSAFVGLGLMFSGITDSCAMGIILSKMPWNR